MTVCPEPLYTPSRPRAGCLLGLVICCMSAAFMVGLVYAVVTGLVRWLR